MTLLLDGIVFSLQRQGGISRWFHELVQRLHRDNIPTLLTLDGQSRQPPPATGGKVMTLARTSRAFERYRRCRPPSKEVVTSSPSVFHSSYYRRLHGGTALPSVTTVYDFTYERFFTGPRRWAHSAQKFAAIRSAQMVICISQSTLDDLQNLVGLRPGQKVRTIHCGVSEVFKPTELPPACRPFVLFVGQRAGYKNFALAVAAMQFSPELELVCVGGGALQPAELACVPAAVRDRVRHAGFVSEDQLNALYNQAVCLVYPSRYEGFGIPVAEAMRAGCPVVSIDCKAVVETGGDALVVADDEPRALSDAILRTAEADFRAVLVAQGQVVAARYSWETNYRAMMHAYQELAGAAWCSGGD